MQLKTYFAQDASGNIIPNAQVFVYLAGTTTLASGLVDQDGAPLTNPFNADSSAAVVFAAPDGEYDVKCSGASRTVTIRAQLFDGGAFKADLASTAAGKGAELVGFKQSATGAVARTVDDKLGEVVSVKDFGAVGDGVTDDTVAIQSAFNASPFVYFPAGVYRVSAPILIQNKAVSIRGAGANVVNVVSTSPTGVFLVTQNNSTYQSQIDGLTITAATGAGGAAISVTGFSGSTMRRHLYVNDLVVTRVSNDAQASFEYAIYTDNARYVNVKSVWVLGGFGEGGASGANYPMKAAFYFADTATGTPVEFFVDSCQVQHAQCGVKVGDSTAANNEGVFISNSVFVAVRDGVRYETFNDSPLLLVQGCHIAAERYGVYTSRIAQIGITNNVIYLRDETSEKFVGVALNIDFPASGRINAIVSKNIIRCNNALTHETDGIKVRGNTATISENQIFDADIAVEGGAGSSNFNIGMNLLTGCNLRYSNIPASTVLMDVNGSFLDMVNSGSSDARYRIGGGATVDRAAYLDLVGDATNTSFGARFIRAGGVNGNTSIQHQGTGILQLLTVGAGQIQLNTNNQTRFTVTATGNVSLAQGSLATTATDGFPYVPRMGGAPTGTPTPLSGRCPMVVDDVNSRLYFYVNGAWRSTALT